MEGGRSWHSEDPRRRKNVSFALHGEISAEVVTKWRRKRRITVGLEQLNARLPPCLFFLSLGTRGFGQVFVSVPHFAAREFGLGPKKCSRRARGKTSGTQDRCHQALSPLPSWL